MMSHSLRTVVTAARRIFRMDVGDDNSGRRCRQPPAWTDTRTLHQKIDQQRPDTDRTRLPLHTMPHRARPPGAGKAGCESRPYQCTQDDTPRTLGVERQPEAFQRFIPDEAELPIREPGHPRGANPIAVRTYEDGSSHFSDLPPGWTKRGSRLDKSCSPSVRNIAIAIRASRC